MCRYKAVQYDSETSTFGDLEDFKTLRETTNWAVGRCIVYAGSQVTRRIIVYRPELDKDEDVIWNEHIVYAYTAETKSLRITKLYEGGTKYYKWYPFGFQLDTTYIQSLARKERNDEYIAHQQDRWNKGKRRFMSICGDYRVYFEEHRLKREVKSTEEASETKL